MGYAKIIAACFAVLSATPVALAQDGCDRFAWPLTRERAWFAQSDLRHYESGAEISALPPAAFVLQLKPESSDPFAMPPERKSRADNASGGSVHVGSVPRAGVYQITLSDYAWIDVIQNGRYLQPTAHTSGRDCPGLRKSIRVELASGPLLLQVSGVEKSAITLAVAPLE